MKILISAYACEPNTGSEHEVGWRWIKVLSKYKHLKFLKYICLNLSITINNNYNKKISRF